MPTSPASTALARAGIARIGSANAAFRSESIAATAAAADAGRAARRLLRDEYLLHGLRHGRRFLEAHPRPREITALVGCDARASGERQGEQAGEEPLHDPSFSNPSTCFSSAAPVSAVKPR